MIKTSPVTGNKTIFEDDGTYICMDSGYQHMEGYLDGTELSIQYEELSPQILKNTRIVDSENRVWYKTIAITPTAILYPDVDGKWKVTTMQKAESLDDINPTFVLIVGEDHMIIDSEHELVFEPLEFEKAMDCFYKLINTAEND